jgi:hypothetical protein
MPYNPVLDPVTAVMPSGLMQAFHMEHRYEVQVDLYADGRSTRRTFATLPRAYASLERKLDETQLGQLYTFWYAHRVEPFYFYNLRETVPPGSYDPSGVNPVGRYVMVFDSAWNDEQALNRTILRLQLREVEGAR